MLIIACKRSLLQNDVNRRTSVFYSFLAKPDYAVSFSNSSAMIWNNSHYLLNKKLPWNFNFPLDTSKGYFDFRWRKLWKTTFCRYTFATAPTRIKTLNLICALNQQIWIKQIVEAKIRKPESLLFSLFKINIFTAFQSYKAFKKQNMAYLLLFLY